MSKLIEKYEILKEKYPNELMLFKTGMFYNFISEDALFVSEKLGLKITNFSKECKKCGFPIDSLSKYGEQLNKLNISFKIIDKEFIVIESGNDYLKSIAIKEFIEILNTTDLNETSPIKALDILMYLKSKVI